MRKVKSHPVTRSRRVCRTELKRGGLFLSGCSACGRCFAGQECPICAATQPQTSFLFCRKQITKKADVKAFVTEKVSKLVKERVQAPHEKRQGGEAETVLPLSNLLLLRDSCHWLGSLHRCPIPARFFFSFLALKGHFSQQVA